MPEDNTAVTPSIPPVDSAVVGSGASTDNASSGAPSVETESKAAPVESPVVDPMVAPVVPSGVNKESDSKEIHAEVAGKIREAKNVLIALSSDPSVDEMAAAIGLSLYLDKLGKRATAIYSGATPNALEFLKPEETFESTADTLQDFVIALSKEKADHLRYKLDGDYVKIYITPYKTRISEHDLDFSYGDFNVDLVLALDVANGIDLDSALREHGRIMHDAVIVNITTGNPGKFGEIEWSEKTASSVSEMIASLLYNVAGTEMGKEEATAFLTGIVAATNRFSNAGTTPETMQIASKLMKSGANQQLVSKNITSDVENEMFSLTESRPTGEKGDPTNLEIGHGAEGSDEVDSSGEGDNEETKEVDAEITEKESTLLEDLKAAEESLSQAGAEAVPEKKEEKVKIDSENNTSNLDEIKNPEIEESATATVETPTEVAAEGVGSEEAPSNPEERAVEAPAQEKVLQPSGDFDSNAMTLEDENKYGKMLEDALESVSGAAATNPAPGPTENPAAMNAPAVPTNPEINGVPEMNYMPMPGEEILPPPPTPPIDMSGATMPTADQAPVVVTPAAEPVAPVAEPIAPAAPAAESEATSLGGQPAMQDQIYGNAAADPGAFKIPGM